MMVSGIDGHPRSVGRSIICRDGRTLFERHLYNWAIQGGDSLDVRPDSIATIKKIDKLPEGLRSAYDVPCDRLLSVNLQYDKVWITRLYDRKNLPVEIKEIKRLLSLKPSRLKVNHSLKK